MLERALERKRDVMFSHRHYRGCFGLSKEMEPLSSEKAHPATTGTVLTIGQVVFSCGQTSSLGVPRGSHLRTENSFEPLRGFWLPGTKHLPSREARPVPARTLVSQGDLADDMHSRSRW